MDHGIPMTPVFKAWFVAVPVAYYAFVGLFRALDLWPERTRGGSRGSDMIAFLLIAGGCCAYLAYYGCIGWLRLGDHNFDDIDKDTFYGKSQFVEDYLIAPMLSYQGWNFLLCIFNPDLRDVNMMGHHFVTGMLGYFGLHPYLHYYGLFFFGFAEITNVPLTFVDAFKYFPSLKDKLSFFNEFSRISFAVSFIVIRLIMWPYISYKFWIGSFDLLQNGKAHSTFVVGFFLFANLFLTFLQFLWGSKIFGFLFKSGKKKSTESNKQK